MDVIDAEDEASEVEGDEDEDGQVEEDEEAEGDGGVHEAGDLADLGVEGREVRSIHSKSAKFCGVCFLV